MKKTFPMILALAAALCSCDNDAECIPCQDGQKTATISIDLGFDEEPMTRAVSDYTDALNYEKEVNNVQILVFDANGDINMYKDAGKSVSGISMNTTTGKKNVWAVVNGPDLSQIVTETELKETAVDLSDNSITVSEGFVMAGYASCEVKSSGTNTTVSVSRLVARVALQKITNRLPAGYGPITIDNVMLINVPGNQSLDGEADIVTWYNKAGRKEGANDASQIINGSANKASCPTLTFATPAESIAVGDTFTPSAPYLTYSYPNATAADVKGWSSTFAPRKTRLVVTATVNSKTYYYPVTIDKLDRNAAYTIEVTITGLGSSDPDRPVEKGILTSAVTVQGWKTGTAINEVI